MTLREWQRARGGRRRGRRSLGAVLGKLARRGRR
jgi:hypothetical protein